VKRTPLYSRHVALGARMVQFGGWEMPVWYAGIVAEHTAVRTQVGLFDVSHMGEFVVHGPGALAFLRRVLTNDAADLAINEAQYTLIPNAEGGTVDDLLLYRLGEDVFLLVVNAGNIDGDRTWLLAQLADELGGTVALDDRSSDTGLLAVQGPRAEALLAPLTELDLAGLPYYHFDRAALAGVQAMVSRTGYTGEDGFEIMAASKDVGAIWDALVTAGAPFGLTLCGLGARDSLRLEAAMPLYGHELDSTVSALEAGLGRFVKTDGKPGQVGGPRLAREKADGVVRTVVGLEILERVPPRQGYPILVDGMPVGVVTSGTLSPTLDKPIAMGFVPPALKAPGTELAVVVRGRAVPAVVVRRPFYRRPKPA
jgi:aminomethyltransferase